MPNDNPILIFTCERSGSTLLRCILDAHPDIYSPGEIGLGALCESLYFTVLYTKGQGGNIGSESARERIVLDEIGAVVGRLMDGYAQAHGKRIWCDKSPANVLHMERLSRVFPSARCICLYRHCMDVVNSCINLSKLGFMGELCPYVSKHPDNLVLAMVENWIDKTTKILEFERGHPARCFRLTYESLVLQPERTLADLFAFIGVTADGYRLDAVFAGRRDFGQMGGDLRAVFSSGISAASIGKGADIPLTYLPDEYRAQMNALLAGIGYPAGGPPAGAEEPEGRVGEVFERVFPERLQADADGCSTVTGVCKFEITGKGGGTWIVDFNHRPVQTRAGDGEADCTIAVAAGHFLDIVHGRQSVAAAYEQGTIGAAGNVNAAIKIGRLLLSGA